MRLEEVDDEWEPEDEVHNECRCGECCRHLIIEADVADAEREPRIKQLGTPYYTHPELTESGQPELEGYYLNAPDGPCVFLDREADLCSIYATRPWACRVFDCDGEGKDKLLQLGIRPGGKDRAR